MDAIMLKEGLEYAETGYKNLNTFSKLDKLVIRENFDLSQKNVLDFGCGMGNMSLWFAKELGAQVDGVDIDENHITVANEFNKKYNVDGVHFYLRNVITDPIDKEYDFIFLNDVIEHINPDWIEGILDVLILKNLKKGGIIFFSYPPWEGPHASHLQRAIGVPWIQFFPQNYVIGLLKKRNQQTIGKNDLMTDYLELNHMTHKMLTRYLKKYQLKRVFRKSHTKLNKIPFLKNKNLNFFPFKFIVTKELIAFQKT